MGLIGGMLGHASEVNAEKLHKEFSSILVENEYIEKAFRIIRDLYVFTNKRLVLVDKQGVTGSKREYLTIPYKSIIRFSKESTGLLDFDAELKIWIVGEKEPIVKEFRKDSSVNDIYKILSKHILG
ncbi:MAG: PH domain-containing protein [Bacteroidota bacterium]|nr:PH domain-containing protein [Bacteroidota bacterium]MDP4205625.1 PH domain-containing protein [Bacteroidota bacterium]